MAQGDQQNVVLGNKISINTNVVAFRRAIRIMRDCYNNIAFINYCSFLTHNNRTLIINNAIMVINGCKVEYIIYINIYEYLYIHMNNQKFK